MKRLLTILAAIFLALLPVTPAFAETIQQPDSYHIDSIEAYQHYLEMEDQLYLVHYTINYATLPATNAQTAWLFELMAADGVTVLGTTVPYAYHTEGYGQGLAVIYFSAATAPIWSGAYSVNMTGNSVLSWNGTAPNTSNSTFAKWSTSTNRYDTSTELTARILYLANQLTIAWGGSDNLTQDIGSTRVLSTNGETYFENTFTELRYVCPALFASNLSQPIPMQRTKNTSAADTSDQQLIGTPFDMTALGNVLGVSRMWATGLVWMVAWLGMTAAIAWKLQATRISLFVFGFAMIAGAITGWMGMLVGILTGIIGALALVFAFLWKGSA